jgi:hypothetical protein
MKSLVAAVVNVEETSCKRQVRGSNLRVGSTLAIPAADRPAAPVTNPLNEALSRKRRDLHTWITHPTRQVPPPVHAHADERTVSLASDPRLWQRPEGERVLAAIADRRDQPAPGVPQPHPYNRDSQKAFVHIGPVCAAVICQK